MAIYLGYRYIIYVDYVVYSHLSYMLIVQVEGYCYVQIVIIVGKEVVLMLISSMI